MSSPKASATLLIQNRRGLHARAAARFVQTVAGFESRVTVRRDGTSVAGGSIMGLMMLAAAKGSTIEVTATGRDADAAIAAISTLVNARFNED
ncbi:HPr family phosphocarrier protein [Zavarzinia sp. CC-PAN008]|uniref:HPr family phosphocarrier protein n=1 Tax=Zavarzinia sp. CC-PAN008 TaxID=3243332 RepID=UPI003F746709